MLVSGICCSFDGAIASDINNLCESFFWDEFKGTIENGLLRRHINELVRYKCRSHNIERGKQRAKTMHRNTFSRHKQICDDLNRNRCILEKHFIEEKSFLNSKKKYRK